MCAGSLLGCGEQAAQGLWHASCAPAPQFFELVNRKFYDGMEIQRADGFVVQTGDPDGPGPETGVKVNGKLRT